MTRLFKCISLFQKERKKVVFELTHHYLREVDSSSYLDFKYTPAASAGLPTPITQFMWCFSDLHIVEQ